MTVPAIYRAAAFAVVYTLALSAPSAQQAEMSTEQKGMLEKSIAFATPGEAHRALAGRAGIWAFEISTWEREGAPPETSTGTSKMEWIMEGRYLADTTTSTFQGQMFTGQGLVGYDNLKKKFVSSWIDNMGTGIVTAEGTYDAAAKTWTYRGEAPDVVAGTYVPVRSVERITGADTWTVEMFKKGHDGREFKTMQIDYTRAK